MTSPSTFQYPAPTPRAIFEFMFNKMSPAQKAQLSGRQVWSSVSLPHKVPLVDFREIDMHPVVGSHPLGNSGVRQLGIKKALGPALPKTPRRIADDHSEVSVDRTACDMWAWVKIPYPQ